MQELRRRDGVYRLVQERFSEDNPQNYQRQLEQLFRREAVLTRIVEEFKKMSNIRLEDPDELLYFLKN